MLDTEAAAATTTVATASASSVDAAKAAIGRLVRSSVDSFALSLVVYPAVRLASHPFLSPLCPIVVVDVCCFPALVSASRYNIVVYVCSWFDSFGSPPLTLSVTRGSRDDTAQEDVRQSQSLVCRYTFVVVLACLALLFSHQFSSSCCSSSISNHSN